MRHYSVASGRTAAFSPADKTEASPGREPRCRNEDMVGLARQPDLLILKLMEKLHDVDPIIRRNAAGALRMQGLRARPAISALAALLADQDIRVRNEAERAIDHLRLSAA
jgi:hypothetical protein